ncbi:Nmd5 protein [Candida orthopsilosis Co 90-125]|uniref:Nmd5 protein n=1 Tax=Candida orthopsilosis (strain 90-125) TaxID=1136231 RepID=H8X7Q5_CANO9|nr:Nmd5 protein [Candida orthopsilosis Co 90-125]CCG23840.1 Nmd5 protein [Candida orthopsilosis Co 90-125]
MINSSLILECFAGTLLTDVQARNNAEAKLRELSIQPGFLGCCLDILAQPETPAHVKKAAAVYFKNRVIKFWNIRDESSTLRIDNDERPVIKDRLLPVILVCDYHIKQQLIPVLRLLISLEFDSWDSLLQQTGELLSQSSNSEDHLYTAMLCFKEIARKFKWTDNQVKQAKLYSIIEQVFPYLLTIGSSIVKSVSDGQEITELKAEILKMILKSYKYVTYYDFPEPLRTRDQVFAWGEFHASVINMNPPTYVTNSDLTEQEKSFLQISKCYKWAVANILRLFIRYASSNTLSRKVSYQDFHDLFLTEFIPHFIQQFLTITEEYCHGNRWLGMTALYQLLEFLSHCVVEQSTWKLIKPYFETLITHLVYPVIVPTDQILEIYEEDPQEYINLCFDITGDYNNAESAALGFIATALHKRRKFCLQPIINLIQNELAQLQQFPEETLDAAKKKEGLLRILGNVSGYLPKDASIEPMLSSLVIPNLNSKHDFLKARAIEVCSQFSDVNFTSHQTLSTLIHGILQNFNDQNVSLPVQFNSALAIQAFIPVEEFKQVLATIVLPTMSKLLEMSNEIDNDAISVVMQECVENFSEQLQPFGVDLMSKLVSQFMRLAVEVNDASQVDVDDFDNNYEDQGDKSMAAVGFINTMITVLLSFENSQEICIKLEEIFSPVIAFVFTNQMDEFYAEVGELMDNSIFLLRSITPCMWSNFDLLYKSFQNGSALMYVEELMPCLQNFLIFGKQELKNNDALARSMFTILQMIISDEDELSVADLNLAFEFAQTFVLTLEEKAAPFVSKLISFDLENFDKLKNRKLTSAFAVNSFNVIVASLIYNCQGVIMLLQQSNHLVDFFNKWFEMIPQLSRVYDLKLSLLGLISLSKVDTLPQEIVQEISHKYVKVLKLLSTAIPELEKKRKDIDGLNGENQAFHSSASFGNDGDDEWEEDFDDIEANEAGHEDHVGGGDGEDDADEDAIRQYTEFLEAENADLAHSGFYNANDEEIFEDPLATTPLDEVNIFEAFKLYLHDLQQNNVNHFQRLFGNLSEDDQKLIVDLINM